MFTLKQLEIQTSAKGITLSKVELQMGMLKKATGNFKNESLKWDSKGKCFSGRKEKTEFNLTV